MDEIWFESLVELAHIAKTDECKETAERETLHKQFQSLFSAFNEGPSHGATPINDKDEVEAATIDFQLLWLLINAYF